MSYIEKPLHILVLHCLDSVPNGTISLAVRDEVLVRQVLVCLLARPKDGVSPRAFADNSPHTIRVEMPYEKEDVMVYLRGMSDELLEYLRGPPEKTRHLLVELFDMTWFTKVSTIAQVNAFEPAAFATACSKCGHIVVRKPGEWDGYRCLNCDARHATDEVLAPLEDACDHGYVEHGVCQYCGELMGYKARMAAAIEDIQDSENRRFVEVAARPIVEEAPISLQVVDMVLSFVEPERVVPVACPHEIRGGVCTVCGEEI